MRKLVTALLLVVLSMSVVAQEDGNQAAEGQVKYSNAFYIHPLSLIVGAAADIIPLMLNFTIEHSLAPKAALILTPNFFTWSLESDNSFGNQNTFSLQAYGLGVGYRKYLGKPSSGVYLQAKLDGGYMTASSDYINYSGIKKTAEFSGTSVSVIGYVGTKGQWDHICMFIDGGLGYGYMGLKAEVDDANLDFDFGSTGLDFDINFGLGYAF